MRERALLCFINIIYGVSYGAMTFDLRFRSKVVLTFFLNITKTMKDRDTICIRLKAMIYMLAFIFLP